MKLVVLFSLLMFASTAFAEVSVNIKCKVKESARGTSTRLDTEVMTLSSEGLQSFAISPVMAMDRGAIFIINLVKGNTYTDALGDEVGADYFLTLSRLQNKTKELKNVKIKGKLQDMLTITEKEGIVENTSYRRDNGKLQLQAPDSLRLGYKLKGSRKVQVRCELIN